MGKLTEIVFDESCCDGGVTGVHNSAQPCGCDLGCRPYPHYCAQHRHLSIPDAQGNVAYVPAYEVISIDEQGTASYVNTTVFHPPKADLLMSIDRTETIKKDPISGGLKGSKLAMFSLIPAEFLWALAEHYGKGAKKYARKNWERGYDWSLTCDALERHYNLWKMGERDDPETGSHHLIAMAWHVIALFIFQLRGLGTDDVRPSS